jgi:hypothetical protein
VNGETIASDSSAARPPPATLKRSPVKDPENHLEGGLKIHKMVHVPANNEEKWCHEKVSSAKHKIRKEISVMCPSCGVALCKISSSNVHHMKKNY